MNTKLCFYIKPALSMLAAFTEYLVIENQSDIVPQAREEIQLDTR